MEPTPDHAARLSVCSAAGEVSVFYTQSHRPEAGTELLHLDEAHPKWKLTQQFYLGCLGMAALAARAIFK